MLGIKRIFRRSAQQKVAAILSVGYDVPNRPDAAGVRFGRDYDNGLARVSFQLFEYGFEFVGGVVDGRIQGADRGRWNAAFNQHHATVLVFSGVRQTQFLHGGAGLPGPG